MARQQRNEDQSPGARSRKQNRGSTNPIRVRTKRLDQINGDKIALAYWLLAKQIVDDKSDQQPTEDEVGRSNETTDAAKPSKPDQGQRLGDERGQAA